MKNHAITPQDLYSKIMETEETEKMKRLGITKNALLYMYHDSEKTMAINYSLGFQLQTILHIAVLELIDKQL